MRHQAGSVSRHRERPDRKHAVPRIALSDEGVQRFAAERARFLEVLHGSTAIRRPKIWRCVIQPLMPPRLLPI